MRCDQCQFYSHARRECRALPPTLLENVTGVFPKICPSEWCGRFAPDTVLASSIEVLQHYRSPGYISEFGRELSEKNAQREVDVIERRKSR